MSVRVPLVFVLWYCQLMVSNLNRSGIKEVMPMQDSSSKRMGHQIDVNRLRAEAVL